MSQSNAPTQARILRALKKAKSQSGLETSELVALVNKGTKYKLSRHAVFSACRRLAAKALLDVAPWEGGRLENIWVLTKEGKSA